MNTKKAPTGATQKRCKNNTFIIKMQILIFNLGKEGVS